MQLYIIFYNCICCISAYTCCTHCTMLPAEYTIAIQYTSLYIAIHIQHYTAYTLYIAIHAPPLAGGWRRSVGARRACRAASGRVWAARGRAAASVGVESAAPPDIRGPFSEGLFSRSSSLSPYYDRRQGDSETSKSSSPVHRRRPQRDRGVARRTVHTAL